MNVKDVTRGLTQHTTFDTFTKWSDFELALNKRLLDTKEKVHLALCDNIDTRTALDVLRDLVTGANIYLKERKPANQVLLYDLSAYVTKMLEVFGTNAGIAKIGKIRYI